MAERNDRLNKIIKSFLEEIQKKFKIDNAYLYGLRLTKSIHLLCSDAHDVCPALGHLGRILNNPVLLCSFCRATLNGIPERFNRITGVLAHTGRHILCGLGGGHHTEDAFFLRLNKELRLLGYVFNAVGHLEQGYSAFLKRYGAVLQPGY